jgi:cold shock CspA family protein
MTDIRSAGAIFASARFDKALSDHLNRLSAPARRKSPLETKLHYGTISTWNKKGYGFVSSDCDIPGCTDRDLFLHASRLPRGMKSIEPGTRIEFTTVPAKLVAEAKVIRIIAEAEAA